MHRTPVLVLLYIWWLSCQQCYAFAVTRTKDYRGSSEVATGKDAVNAEPSCEELKAMWRFSKRQSRAAEITNEIPRYRDPFTYNLWEPPYYARSRSIAGPVLGKVIHKAPLLKNRAAFEEVAKLYGTLQRGTERRRVTAFRLPGGGASPQSGSFQHLKDLIRKEKARELQEQRMAEQLSAGALNNYGAGHHNQASLRDMAYLYDSDERDDREPIGVNEGLLAFPNLLAPAAPRVVDDEARYVSDYSFPRDSPRHHSSSLFDTSSFNNDFDGYML